MNLLCQEQFYETIGSLPAGKSPFDDKFFAFVRKQHAALGKLLSKLIIVQIPIFTFLVLGLIPIHVQFSILGVSPDANKNLREVLVVISAILGLITAAINLNRNVLDDLTKAHLRRQSKGKKDVAELLEIAYGFNVVGLPNPGFRRLLFGGSYTLFLLSILIVILLLVAAIIVAAGTIHFLILRDIYQQPSFSTLVSICVIGFVLICDLLVLALGILGSGMVPMQDFENLRKLTDLQELYPERAKKMYQAIIERHYRKPFFWRIMSRPKIPKNLHIE